MAEDSSVGAARAFEVERLRRAVRGSTDGLWEWDVRSGELWLSPRARTLLGDDAAATGPAGSWEALRQRLAPVDVEAFDRALDATLRDSGEIDVTVRIRSGDQSRWFRVRGAAEPDPDGRVALVSGSLQDVDELSRALDRNAYLAAIVDSWDDAVLGLDLEGTIVSWNGGAARLFEKTVEEVQGQPVARLGAWARLDVVPDLLPAALRGEPAGERIVEHRRGDGRRAELAVSLSPVRDARGLVVGAALVARDVTARRATDRRLANAGRELRRKNDELEQFVYTVSHDLKSPLVTCTGYVGLLEEDFEAGDAEAARDSCRRIRNAVTKMGRLIDDLLELSRIGRRGGERRRVDLRRVVDDLVIGLRPRFEERGVRLEVVDDLPSAAWADEHDLSRAVENLLDNALKYACDEPGSTVTVGGRTGGDEVLLMVKDDGPGIEPEYHQRIFGLFQRLEAEKPGTGVGLASVAKVMAVHGGRAWVESEPGEGSTFWLAFPEPSEDDQHDH